MRSRLVLATTVAALAGLLALLAAGRVWGRAVAVGPTGVRQHLSVTGSQVAGALPALALAIPALALATWTARRLARRLCALAGVAVAGALVAVSVGAHGDIGRALADRGFAVVATRLPVTGNAWWLVSLGGGVLAAAAFAAVVVAGRAWAGPGARYDAPGAPTRAADPDVAAWEALDRGDDPTM